jgi:hypothetical protein
MAGACGDDGETLWDEECPCDDPVEMGSPCGVPVCLRAPVDILWCPCGVPVDALSGVACDVLRDYCMQQQQQQQQQPECSMEAVESLPTSSQPPPHAPQAWHSSTQLQAY